MIPIYRNFMIYYSPIQYRPELSGFFHYVLESSVIIYVRYLATYFVDTSTRFATRFDKEQ